MRQDLKLAVLLGFLCALATAALFPYLIEVLPETLANVPVSLPFLLLVFLQCLQAFVILTALAFLGLRMSHRVALDAPWLRALLARRALPKLSWQLAIVLGVVAGGAVFGLDVLFASHMPAMLQAKPAAPPVASALTGFLASFYGGINEEVQLRLFVMTLLVWLMSFLTPRRYAAYYWIAIVVAAVLFGVGHLPAAAKVWPFETIVIVRTIVLNAVAGIVFGWLYWKRGLEMAMLAHFSADIVLHVFVPLATPSTATFDVVIKGGTVYDGSGSVGFQADVGIKGDRIVSVGDLNKAKATTVVDAHGLAVAPGFINMLSWANESLIADGRSQGDIRQGVTTEIMGEGESMGPLNETMKKRFVEQQGDIKYDIEWTTLSEYLKYLEKRGVSANVASFIGAATIREYVIGLEDKAPTVEQLEQMRELVRREMQAGALGIGSSLIYAPAFYAKTEELTELCKVAAQYQGKYISHMRSEGNRLLESIDELIRISREAKIPAEIYHLKAAGKDNWPKMDDAIAKIEGAQKEGLKITADMYLYTAGATGLDASLPPSALDGGYESLFKRLQDPVTRKKLAQAVQTPSDDWENLYLAAGSPDRIITVGFKSEKLKPLTGKTLSEIAKMRGTDPVETIMDLILEDRSRVGTIYFLISEDNIKKQLKRPWVSIGSDAESEAPEGVFLKSNPHPRAYGNFARLLGKYVRDEKVIELKDAVYRLSGLPATNLGLDHRGFIKNGYFADLAIFDPATIADKATFDRPHQYAVGMKHVFVNGVHVLKDGEHTGAKPGRALWGPGKIKVVQ